MMKFPIINRFFPSFKWKVAAVIDKYIADLCTPDDKWYKEYFVNQTEVFKWFEVISGQSVESITEILAIAEQRKDENDNSFCNIYEYAAG